MKYFVRYTKIALVSLLALGIASSALIPAQAATPLKITDIYNPLKILRVDLNIPANSVTSLRDPQKAKTYVPASVNMSVDGRTSGDIAIDIRLKGTTSFIDGGYYDENPSFKIKFPKRTAPNGYLGLKRITLNALIQDNSKVHEFGAYTLFNAMGVPASKTGWVRLYINGADRGLYANIEQPDQIFMQKRFKDVTQHIYEGIANKDLNFGNDSGTATTGEYLVDYGWKVTPNKDDLTELINYASDWDPASWYKELPKVMDRTALIKAFAVENFLGHWDSYSGPLKNNYFLRSNTRGYFTYIPWGVDQTFGENRKTEVLGDTFYLPLLSETSPHPWNDRASYRGKLYVSCINYKPCRTQYLKELKAVSLMATKIKLGSQMQAAAKLVNPVLQVQYKNTPELITLAKSEQARSIGFIAKRQAQVAALLKKNNIK
jgi:spore coat protein CotH